LFQAARKDCRAILLAKDFPILSPFPQRRRRFRPRNRRNRVTTRRYSSSARRMARWLSCFALTASRSIFGTPRASSTTAVSSTRTSTRVTTRQLLRAVSLLTSFPIPLQTWPRKLEALLLLPLKDQRPLLLLRTEAVMRLL